MFGEELLGPHASRSPWTSYENGVARSPQPPCAPAPHAGLSPLVPEEDESGNVEYKLQILPVSAERFDRLVTQLSWRLTEGGGSCVYELGVRDDGALVGISLDDMRQSLAYLCAMAQIVGARVLLQRLITKSSTNTSETTGFDTLHMATTEEEVHSLLGLARGLPPAKVINATISIDALAIELVSPTHATDLTLPFGAIKHKILPEAPTTEPSSKSTLADMDGDVHPDLHWDDDGDVDDANLARLEHIPEGSMRRDALRLTRKARSRLPRVTAYSTATSYRMRELIQWLEARKESHHTNVLRFDECVYTTYTYQYVDEARGLPSSSPFATHRSRSHGGGDAKTGDLLGIPELQENSSSEEGEEGARNTGNPGTPKKPTSTLHFVPEIFIMEYGTIVIWGMSQTEEKRLLREIRKFEVERLALEDVESEDLNWYLADYSRIYNDVITLRRGSSYMTKLSLSHALAQSTKISFFESVIEATIDTTKDIPRSIAESGKVGMPPVDIMKHIGHLFILRMNIHLVGSIVDSPEIFWAQPDLEPLYSAARSYLEIPQRIDLLNIRVEVLQDMLQLLKDQVTSSHSEWLEIIVIILIVLEFSPSHTMSTDHSPFRHKYCWDETFTAYHDPNTHILLTAIFGIFTLVFIYYLLTRRPKTEYALLVVFGGLEVGSFVMRIYGDIIDAIIGMIIYSAAIAISLCLVYSLYARWTMIADHYYGERIFNLVMFHPAFPTIFLLLMIGLIIAGIWVSSIMWVVFLAFYLAIWITTIVALIRHLVTSHKMLDNMMVILVVLTTVMLVKTIFLTISFVLVILYFITPFYYVFCLLEDFAFFIILLSPEAVQLFEPSRHVPELRNEVAREDGENSLPVQNAALNQPEMMTAPYATQAQVPPVVSDHQAITMPLTNIEANRGASA
ncbi:sporulation protein rmd1 [Malassezia brasiliensis]|uniref:Sporulation protein rmd1 n=1 Tax=Malassezia brasiliensis TaxID=1821822 RepID=A0AAF0DW05_9BASI|nr:sporulation protein rmd1 [Malassezia brasiliensis]